MSKDTLFYTDGTGPMIPVATLGLTRLFGVAADGLVSQNSIPFDLEYLTSDGFAKPINSSGNHVFETGSKALTLEHGAAVVLGKPYSGKTLFADTLKARNPSDVTVLRFREPEDDAMLYERTLVAKLFEALHAAPSLIFIDSLRTTFYVSSGATGKGGVNMAIFGLLTAYDLLARHHNKIIMFSLNPMTTDDDAIQFYLEAAKGSVAHTLYATQPKALTISSRSATNRDDYRQKYEPVTKESTPKLGAAEAAPVLIRESRDSIVDLYITTSR